MEGRSPQQCQQGSVCSRAEGGPGVRMSLHLYQQGWHRLDSSAAIVLGS